MAHVAKVKSAGVAPMVGHYAREAEKRGYERDNIDPSRTALNYEIRSGSRPLADQVRGRIAEAVESHERVSGKALRKDANVMFDWVVTLPKDCPEARARDFFAAAVGFIQGRYGKENVPGGFVHMDEATPHVHVPVVPVRGGKLVGAKVVDRRDLKTFHKDLSAAVDAELGLHVSIELDESQKGAKQLSALSQEEYRAAKDELARARAELGETQVKLAESERGVEEQQALAADLSTLVSEKTERLESLQRLEAAENREIAQLGAIEAAGAVDLGARALGRGLGERERAVEEENRGLKDELAALEDERRGLGERAERARAAIPGARLEADRAAREYARGLARECRGLERDLRELESRRGDLADKVAALVGEWFERGSGFIAGVSERVASLLGRIGITAYAGPPPLEEVVAQSRASSEERNRERSAPARHNSRGISL